MAVRTFGSFVIRLATTADATALRPIIRHVLATEPSGVISSMTASDFDELADQSAFAMPATRRMWVMEAPDKRIASFLASTDITTPSAPPEIDALIGDKYGRLDDLDQFLLETYCQKVGFTKETMPHGHSVYLDVGGTLPEFTKMGMNGALYQQLLRDSDQRGYFYVASIAYNKFTQAIATATPGVEVLHVEDLGAWIDGDKLAQIRAEGNDKVALIQQQVSKHSH